MAQVALSYPLAQMWSSRQDMWFLMFASLVFHLSYKASAAYQSLGVYVHQLAYHKLHAYSTTFKIPFAKNSKKTVK